MRRIKYKIESVKLPPHELDPKVGGVYCIQCLINEKKYIGATVGLKYRLAQHKSKLNKGIHPNIILQKDWIEFGSDQFVFSVIEYCKYMLWEKERKYNLEVIEDKRYSHLDRNRLKKIPKSKRIKGK